MSDKTVRQEDPIGSRANQSPHTSSVVSFLWCHDDQVMLPILSIFEETIPFNLIKQTLEQDCHFRLKHLLC